MSRAQDGYLLVTDCVGSLHFQLAADARRMMIMEIFDAGLLSLEKMRGNVGDRSGDLEKCTIATTHIATVFTPFLPPCKVSP